MRSQQIHKLYKALHSNGTLLTRSVRYSETVAISQPRNRGVIMSELRQKIYSKKRMMMANVISGMSTGGFTGYFVTNASSVLTIVCLGAALGLLLHLSIVPKLWGYRFREIFKGH